MRPFPPVPSRAFTVVELLVVVAIIAILAALIVPVASRMARKAGTAKTVNNQKQIFVLFSLYAAENNGKFPPAQTDDGKVWSKDFLDPLLTGTNASGWDDLSDTIFTSPNAAKEGQKDNPDATKVVEAANNRGFGMNVYLPSPDGAPYDGTVAKPAYRKPSLLVADVPSRQMLLMDC